MPLIRDFYGMGIQAPNCFLIVAVAITVVAGCDGTNGQVSGRVARSDGKPIERVRVIARTEDGKSAVGITDADGQFKLSSSKTGAGVEAGEYTVILVEDRGRTDNMRPATIPAKYADPSLSGLTLTVQAGDSKTLDVTVDSL